MKPTLLLDCDGILANFIEACLALLAVRTGRKYAHDVIKTWDVFDSLPTDKHLRPVIYDELKRPNGCLNIPVYPGAQAGVAKLREHFEVVIVTSPFVGAPTWMSERETWLKRHFDIGHKNIIHTHQKHRILGDVFIDDKVEHVEQWTKQWQRLTPTPVAAALWDRRYNQAAQLPRVHDWEEVLALRG